MLKWLAEAEEEEESEEDEEDQDDDGDDVQVSANSREHIGYFQVPCRRATWAEQNCGKF
jgi:hypothetical protein